MTATDGTPLVEPQVGLGDINEAAEVEAEIVDPVEVVHGLGPVEAENLLVSRPPCSWKYPSFSRLMRASKIASGRSDLGKSERGLKCERREEKVTREGDLGMFKTFKLATEALVRDTRSRQPNIPRSTSSGQSQSQIDLYGLLQVASPRKNPTCRHNLWYLLLPCLRKS